MAETCHFQPGRAWCQASARNRFLTASSAKWVSSAEVGETIEIGGPRGSTVVPDDFDWYLLVGDETALPAIGRRVEELRIGVPVTTVVTVANAAEKQVWQTPASWNPIWILRDEITADDEMAALRTSLARCGMPPGDGMVWIAAETSVARAFYAHMLNDRHHPRAWIKGAGYWTRGQSDSHGRIGESSLSPAARFGFCWFLGSGGAILRGSALPFGDSDRMRRDTGAILFPIG
jgi:Siderophore-interacting protein